MRPFPEKVSARQGHEKACSQALTLKGRDGRQGSCLPCPHTEPGVRFSRTGLPPETFTRLDKRLVELWKGQFEPGLLQQMLPPSLRALTLFTQGLLPLSHDLKTDFT